MVGTTTIRIIVRTLWFRYKGEITFSRCVHCTYNDCTKCISYEPNDSVRLNSVCPYREDLFIWDCLHMWCFWICDKFAVRKRNIWNDYFEMRLRLLIWGMLWWKKIILFSTIIKFVYSKDVGTPYYYVTFFNKFLFSEL